MNRLMSFARILAGNSACLLIYGLLCWAEHDAPRPIITGAAGLVLAVMIMLIAPWLPVPPRFPWRIRFERSEP